MVRHPCPSTVIITSPLAMPLISSFASALRLSGTPEIGAHRMPQSRRFALPSTGVTGEERDAVTARSRSGGSVHADVAELLFSNDDRPEVALAAGRTAHEGSQEPDAVRAGYPDPVKLLARRL